VTCPPLIELSQYLDHELDDTTRRAVAAHLEGCIACAQSVEQLLRIAVHRDPARTEAATEQCPNAESLLLFALNGSTGETTADRHIDDCDPCLQTLQRLHHNVQMIPDMAVPVPAAVRERAFGHAKPRGASPRPVATRPRRADRLTAWLRPPILAPVAFAAGMLLYVAGQQMPNPSLPASASRSVPQAASVLRHVTAPEVWVYEQPTRRAEVVTKLARGAAVEVSIAERGWYRVALADGRIGWIEEHSLR